MKPYVILFCFLLIQISGKAQTDITFDDINNSKDIDDFIEIISNKGYLVADKDEITMDNVKHTTFNFNKTGEKSTSIFDVPISVIKKSNNVNRICLTYNSYQSSSFETIISKIKLNCTKVSSEYNENLKCFKFIYENSTSKLVYTFFSHSMDFGRVHNFLYVDELK